MSKQASEDGERWESIRTRVLERDGRECRFCGMSEDEHIDENSRSLDVHHIIPKGDGGEDSMSNLAALCRQCHRTIENLHGQAMGEMAEKRDHRQELDEIGTAIDDLARRYEDAEFELREFLRNHPTFSEEFDFDLLEQRVECLDFDVPLREQRYPRSEWEAAALYGYCFAMTVAIYRIEKNTAETLGKFRVESDE